MKIATWNVNGIRARQAQVEEFIEKEQPDVLCLQEIKATIDQLPLWLCDIEGYWCYWHGGKGYSGVGLHVRKSAAPERPVFEHPEFDYESRIVTARLPQLTVASIYVPNGGKDFPAKMRFLESLASMTDTYNASNRPLVLCGDFNVARTDMDVHPKERKPNVIGQRPDERELLERIIGHGLVDVHRRWSPTIRICSPGGRRGATCGSATSDGAWILSWPRGDSGDDRFVCRSARVRHERSWAGDCRVRRSSLIIATSSAAPPSARFRPTSSGFEGSHRDRADCCRGSPSARQPAVS